MFDAGLTLFEVQQRLGHKSPTMTAEVYTHLMRERFDEGAERHGGLHVGQADTDETDQHGRHSQVTRTADAPPRLREKTSDPLRDQLRKLSLRPYR
jgi:hypothetical protein